MTSPLKYATKFPTLCGCCRRRASHIGYTPDSRQPIMWICEDAVCIETAKKAYRMKQKDLDDHEGRAVNEGINAAGSYMAELGKFDLRELSEIELSEWGRRFYLATCSQLQSDLAALNAPF